MQKLLAFRADGNSKIGMGHVMRCLSVANAAKNAGYQCVFILADHSCESVIKENDIETICLDSNCYNLESEVDKMITILEKYNFLSLIVDSYYATEYYLETCRKHLVAKDASLVCFDGFFPFLPPCDVLINYNVFGKARLEKLKNLYIEHARKLPLMLAGTRFTPLRQEFLNIDVRVNKTEGKNIFISTGGADSYHIALELVKEIINSASSLIYHIVVGKFNKDKGEILSLSTSHDNIHIYCDVNNICQLMMEADIAVSASGSTLYEVCATQTPTITYVLADNQVAGADEFSRQDIMINAGDVRVLGNKRLARQLIDYVHKLSLDFTKRCIMSGKMRDVVDGNGAKRIIDAVGNMTAGENPCS